MLLKLAEEFDKKKNEGDKEDSGFRSGDKSGYKTFNNDRSRNNRNQNNRNQNNRNQNNRNRNNGNQNNRNRNNHNQNNRNDYRGREDRRGGGNRNFQNNNTNDDKMGWSKPDAKFLAGAGAIAGAGALAMSGGMTPKNKYLSETGKKAYGGMRRYVIRSAKPLHRSIFNIGEKVVRDVNRSRKSGRLTADQQVDKRFRDIANRRINPNNKHISNNAADSLNTAKSRNEIERTLAKKEGRKPIINDESPEYHFAKAERDYINRGVPGEDDNRGNKFNEYKGIVGTSVLGGSGFALGITGIHTLERALESKNQERINRERREQSFKSMGSFVDGVKGDNNRRDDK